MGRAPRHFLTPSSSACSRVASGRRYRVKRGGVPRHLAHTRSGAAFHASPSCHFRKGSHSRSDRNRMNRRATFWRRRTSRPWIEVLEERTLLSIDMVMNSDDSGAGSLRNAIATAAPGDTIEFDMALGHVNSPIVLTTGALDLTQDIKIVGPGPGELTISGNSASTILSVASGVNAKISGLTLANGKSESSAGGIFNLGHLTLTDDVLSNNTGALAGGIFSESGSLSMSGCTSTLNSASSASGGGIYVLSSAVTIKDSTFDNNNATFFGGAIFNNAGAVSLINSTITANSSEEGGGIDNYGGLSLTNCTVADNSSQDDGGGINNDVSGTMTLANTIVADNSALVVGPDYNGTVTSDSGNNLIGDDSGSIGFTQPSDLLNVNPDLAALTNNGGPTQTIGLEPGSPAIDAGNNALVPSGVTADQRGFAHQQWHGGYRGVRSTAFPGLQHGRFGRRLAAHRSHKREPSRRQRNPLRHEWSHRPRQRATRRSAVTSTSSARARIT